jgi:hypothetical protein
MTIRVECDQCFKTYNVPDERLGQRIKCKACGNPMVVGAEESAEEVPAALPPRSRRPTTSGGRAKTAPAAQSRRLVPWIVAGVVFLVAAVGGFFLVKMMTGASGNNAEIAANGGATAAANNAASPADAGNSAEPSAPIAQPTNATGATVEAPAPTSTDNPLWVAHDAPDGWYEIRFPEAPKVADQATQVARQPVTLHTANVMRGNADALIVVWSDYPFVPGLGTTAIDKGLVDQSLNSLVMAFRGSDAKAEPIEREGVHGTKATFSTPAGFGECHIMLVEGRMFQISALRSTEGGFTDADFRTFFDSFKVNVPREAAELTAEEFDEKLMTIPPGTFVRVRGQISSLDMELSSGTAAPPNVSIKLSLPGTSDYASRISTKETAEFSVLDPNGLVEGQEVVLVGRAYPSHMASHIGMAQVISRNEVPPHSAEPFVLPSAERVAELREASSDQGLIPGVMGEGMLGLFVVSSNEALTQDGLLLPIVIDRLNSTPTLPGVRISGIPVTQGMIEQLSTVAHLRDIEFDLGNQDNPMPLSIKDIDFTPLAKLKSLTSLSIQELPDLSNAHLKQISELPCLRHLNLRIGAFEHGALSDEGFMTLSSLTSLVSLRISSWNGSEDVFLTDSSLTGFKDHPNLAIVSVSCDGLEGQCFEILSTCPRLNVLEMTSYKFGNKGFGVFAQESWPTLREISLGSVEDADSGASLERVVNAMPDELRSLELYGPSISGDAIDAIVNRGFSRLSVLSLTRAEITDADVEKLSGLQSLTRVSLPFSISDGAKQKLKASLAAGAEVD